MTKTLDNIGTEMSPTWRARMRAPFTVYAVRMELAAQAAQLPEWEREAYLDARLTDLDRALDCDQAEALERWLDCEAMLQGRPATLGDGGGRGGGRSSLLDDEALPMLAEHALVKSVLSVRSRKILAVLSQMMAAQQWKLIPHFISGVRHSAAELTKIAHVHAQQIAQPLTKRGKSRP